MNRPLIVAIIGVVVVIAAIVLNFTLEGPTPEEQLDLPPTSQADGEPFPTDLVPTVLQVSPSFDVVRIDPQGNTVIAGRAEPGATILILDGESEIGKIVADGRGEWVFIPPEPLPPGTRQLSLEVRVEGGDSLVSENVVVMSVPERDGEVLIIETARGGGGSRVLQGPSAPPELTALTIESVDYDAGGRFYLSGRADPGSVINIYLDNSFIGRGEVDVSGYWLLSPESLAAAGSHVIRADQVGVRSNNVLARVEIPFNLDQQQVDLDPGSVTILKGNSLWRIARRIYGEGVMYTVIYEANKEQIKDPDLIYPGQIFSLPVRDRL